MRNKAVLWQPDLFCARSGFTEDLGYTFSGHIIYDPSQAQWNRAGIGVDMVEQDGLVLGKTLLLSESTEENHRLIE